MESVAKSAFDVFGAFPIVQVAVAAAVFYAIWAAATRGSRDNASKPPEGVPQWLLIAPAHDLISDVADLLEQSRQQTKLLEKIDASLIACKVALELIRDESRLR